MNRLSETLELAYREAKLLTQAKSLLTQIYYGHYSDDKSYKIPAAMDSAIGKLLSQFEELDDCGCDK